MRSRQNVLVQLLKTAGRFNSTYGQIKNNKVISYPRRVELVHMLVCHICVWILRIMQKLVAHSHTLRMSSATNHELLTSEVIRALHKSRHTMHITSSRYGIAAAFNPTPDF